MQSAPDNEPEKQEELRRQEELKKQHEKTIENQEKLKKRAALFKLLRPKRIEAMQSAPDKEPKKQDQPEPQPAPEGQVQELVDILVDIWDMLSAEAAPNPERQELNLPIPKPGYIRQIIDFSPSAAKALRELAKGGAIGDTLRDAIALSKWFKDTREEGGRILVERNGKVREVITIKYPADK